MLGVARDDVLERDDHQCLKCGWGSSTVARFEIHHVYPSSSGGSDDMENLVTLCTRCHENAPDNLTIGRDHYRALMEAYLQTDLTPEEDMMLFGAIYRERVDRSESTTGAVELLQWEFSESETVHHRKFRWVRGAMKADLSLRLLVQEETVPDWYEDPPSWAGGTVGYPGFNEVTAVSD